MSGVRVTTRRLSFHIVREPEPEYPLGSTVVCPREVVAIAQHVIGDEIAECVIAIFLNARHGVIGYAEIARGTLNTSRFQARDVLVPALYSNASAIVVCHNHPSGCTSPSRADRVVTIALRDAARLIGITLLDHVIVGAVEHFSFREHEGWDGDGTP
jgi:DNA repair protein RadC